MNNSLTKTVKFPFQFFVFTMLIFISASLSAQCPEGLVEFNTQAEVDNFIVQFPDCTIINATLNIGNANSNSDISNLDGIANLTQVNGKLIINQVNMTDLSGLANLSSITEGLFISDMQSLTSLNGLDNLDFAGFDINIENLNNLVSVEGLANINFIFSHLTINNCNSLPNLNGLQHLTEMRGLTISNNDLLNNLFGLENLTSAGVTIEGNEMLFNISGLDNLTTVNWLEIIDNPVLNSLEALANLTAVTNQNYTTMILRGNPMLASLAGLENLTIIEGDLIIEECNSLVNMEGFNGLKTADRVIIDRNSALETLSGFNNLSTIDQLFVRENETINSLIGLDSITVVNSIHIEDNDSLESLAGLENLNTVNFLLAIRRNFNLTNISSLNNLQTLQAIELFNNSSLSTCNVLCEILSAAINVRIENNNSGCNNVEQLEISCANAEGIGSLHTQTFYDLNEDGVKDAGEPLLQIGTYEISQLSQSVIGNNTIGGLSLLEYGDYDVIFSSFENWTPTTTETFSVSLSNAQNVDTIFVGLTPTTIISNVSTAISYNQPKCNEFVTFNVTATNQGTTIADGMMTLNIDTLITDVEIVDQPDNFNPPTNYFWSFENLAPGQSISKEIKLRLPGPPDINSGSWMVFNSEVEYEDLNGMNTAVHEPINIQIQCFPTSNDKLFQPIKPNFFSLVEDELTFTVRFQNTSNEEASRIVIEDEIDVNLDLSTFRLIGSSHEAFLSSYVEGRKLTFEFNEIFLPTSNTDFDASQGYILYRISPNPDIEEFTVIENTANIHFDNNPVINTNTTQNNMVFSLDHDEDGFMLWEDCDDFNAAINTSAPETPNNDIDENCDGIIVVIDDDMDGFNSDVDCDDANASINPDATEILDNDIDEDCDGVAQTSSTIDEDMDGFNSDVDCDDNNPAINPGAEEIPGNGIDEDCDGQDLMTATTNLITFGIEIAPNPFVNQIFVTKSNNLSFNYQLLDLQGRILSTGNLNQRNNQLDFNNINSGIYFLKIMDQETDTFAVEKMVKM